MKIRQLRLLRLVPVLLLVSAVPLGGVAGASLPPQASDQGVAHAHTHGPDSLALDRRAPGAAGVYSVDNHAPWNRCEYDAAAPKTADATDLPGLSGLPQVHAVYVVPAKTPSRFPQFAAMFQADARQASALVQTLGRDVRWDLRTATLNPTYCGGATVLDITVFQSRYNARQLAGSNQFSLVYNELKASGRFNVVTKKYVAWLDAGSQYCGQGSLYQDTTRSATNASEINRTTGIVYRPYANDAATGGFCRGRTLLHELGHNLGAVQQVAPHAFDGAHCNDDNNDTMCYTATGQPTSPEGPQFDSGKNDYWDLGASKPTTADDGYPRASSEMLGWNVSTPSLSRPSWWALNLSRYLCPPVPPGVAGPSPADCTKPNADPGYLPVPGS
jgi:hypothetical protein